MTSTCRDSWGVHHTYCHGAAVLIDNQAKGYSVFSTGMPGTSVMLTPHTPHLYTWPRFRGVFVGYIEILRYTSDLPLGGLGSSFLSEARLQSCSLAPSCPSSSCILSLQPYLSLVH